MDHLLNNLQELNMTESDAMFPINLELINQLWLPNVYIYNLKTFKVRIQYAAFFCRSSVCPVLIEF
jgi:hypothetical protein